MTYGEQDKKALIVQDQRLEQWDAIWKLRVSGKSDYDIAKAFGLTITQVRNVLAECRKEFRKSIKGNIEEEMHLDLARCDKVISDYSEVAAMGTVLVIRNRNGECSTDEEWKYPLAATKMVLDAVKLRAAILGYGKAMSQDKREDSDSILWMRRANDAKEVKIVKSEPANGSQDAPLDLSWPE